MCTLIEFQARPLLAQRAYHILYDESEHDFHGLLVVTTAAIRCISTRWNSSPCMSQVSYNFNFTYEHPVLYTYFYIIKLRFLILVFVYWILINSGAFTSERRHFLRWANISINWKQPSCDLKSWFKCMATTEWKQLYHGLNSRLKSMGSVKSNKLTNASYFNFCFDRHCKMRWKQRDWWVDIYNS